MPTLELANKARADKFLASLISSDGQVFTMKDFIHHQIAQGYMPVIAQVEDKAKRADLERQLNRLIRSGEPSGNPNWPATKKYREIKAELADKIVCNEYRLQNGDRWSVITKTAYEYAARP